MLQYMLDTNIVIYTMKNRPERVRSAFKKHHGRMCISSVTVGELIYGAERSAIPQRNLEDIEQLMGRIEAVPFDTRAATHFGRIKAALATLGKPIGSYDAMIAGHARALALVLVTNNMREFQRVPGLMIENWA